VTVAQGTACLGPVTQSGCDAICPTFNRGCYGCYGPAAQPNLVSLTNQFAALGVPRDETVRSLRGFNGYAPQFRAESDRIEASGESTP
jgi:coenzyme F420-reducing hydrogenase gamma subunit